MRPFYPLNRWLRVLLLLVATGAAAAESGPAIRWQGWSDTLFQQAVELDRPVIVYLQSAWCLACREFEAEVLADPEIVRRIQDGFLALEVDADLRPDLFSRYERGGLPSITFLTPRGNSLLLKDGERYLPSGGSNLRADALTDYLDMIQGYYRRTRGRLDMLLEERMRQLRATRNRESRPISAAMVDVGVNAVLRVQDPIYGGLQGPGRAALRLPVEATLQRYADDGAPDYRRFAVLTLDAMARRPIRDPLSGAFYRASARPDWSQPVEGWLLGVQAEMLRTYLEAYRVLGEERYRRVAEDLVQLLLDRFREPATRTFRAAVYPAVDRPTGGWDWESVAAALKRKERAAAALRWGLPAGPDEAAHFPWLAMEPEEVAVELQQPEPRVRERLRDARTRLVARRDADPGWATEDTVLAGEVGRTVAALLEAWAVLGRTDARDAALEALDSVGRYLALPEDGVFHALETDPMRVVPARLLVDQVALSDAWMLAFSATGKRTYLDFATTILGIVLERFRDEDAGGFVDRLATVADVGDLAVPDRRLVENCEAVLALLRWHYMTQDRRPRIQAERTLDSFADEFTAYGVAGAAFGIAVDRYLRRPVQVIVVEGATPDAADALRAAAMAALPLWKIVRPVTAEDDAGYLRARGIVPGDGAAAWVLDGAGLRGPFTTPEALLEGLAGGSGPEEEE